MSAPNDGGPAFPFTFQELDGQGNPRSGMITHVGMSLRDWFAGQALSGLLASGHFTIPNDEEDGGAWMSSHEDPYDENGDKTNLGLRKFDFPEAAWRCADAMLRERNGKP